MADRLDVLFVCLHGAAKSVVAAEYFRRLAGARGMAVKVAAAGVEPDDSIPPSVVDGLRQDGIGAPAGEPQLATAELLGSADVIVSLGCDLSAATGQAPGRHLIRWDDVPAVSDGYEIARTEIVQRVSRLLDELTGARRPL